MAALHCHQDQEDSGIIHWWQCKPGHVSLALEPADGHQCIVTVIIAMRASALVPLQNLGLVTCSSRQCCLVDLWHMQSLWGRRFQKGRTTYLSFTLHLRDSS